MKRFLKEPLIHFLILGALVFAAYSWLTRERVSEDQITVTRGQQEHLINMFTRTWQRPPTSQEFQGLLLDYIREEIAYREGVAMGFDEGDTIVRRRMRQKLELLTDEIVSFTEPTDAELEAYLREHPGDFRLEPRYDLRQIYISQDRRGQEAEAHALALLGQLENEPGADWSEMGDPLPLPAAFIDARLGELERQFGGRFAAGLQEIEPGAWTGPVASGFGLHLVIVDRFTPARDPGLGEVRDRVKTEWLEQRRRNATDELYQRMAEKYTIQVEPLTGDAEG